ncbi:MAG: TspO/MBR family protein [Sphingomonadales bacterium]
MSASSSAHPGRNPPSWFVLVIALLICVGGGALSGLLSSSGPSPWYDSLMKSALTPPSWTFGVVWPVLYVMMAVAVWMVWMAPAGPDRHRALILFAVQLGVNFIWSPIFFGANLIGLSVLVIFLLVVLVILTIFSFARVRRTAALLLVPYLAWGIFAFYLSLIIWIRN